jgi:hypothetical protein
MEDGMARRDGSRRWLTRRKLYAGGALMVLAPFAGAGCDEAAKDADAAGPADAPDAAPADFPADYVAPEVIAIAPPWDPGPLDVQELIDPWTPPEVIAIAPPQDVIAPDQPPEIIAIAPPPQDVAQPEAIAIAPFDAGPQPCFPEGSWCSDDLMCRPQAICIVPTDCCGGCECEPVPCNPAKPSCPEGSYCVDDGNSKGHCVLGTPPAPQKGGFMDTCLADDDCLQEYFCEQTMFCIAPPPGDGNAKPAGCNEKNCVPMPCKSMMDPACPAGSQCVPYGLDTKKLHEVPTGPFTCGRGIPGGPGTLFDGCDNSKSCASDQYRCIEVPGCAFGAMCILPVDPHYLCVPIKCGEGCPEGTACEHVGIDEICVKKAT